MTNLSPKFPTILLLLTAILLTTEGFTQIFSKVSEVSTLIPPGKTETAFFRFKTGDQVLFYLQEQNDENVSRIELKTFQGNVHFSDYLVYRTDSIFIQIQENIVLELRIQNEYDSLSLEVSYALFRISKDSLPFSTEVRWKEITDSIPYTEEIKLAKADTSYEILCKRVEQIPAGNFLNKKLPKQVIKIDLPPGTKEIAYWIGVGQEAQEVYKNTMKSLMKNMSTISMLIPEYGPIIALFFNGASFFTIPTTGENVNYYLFRNQEQANKFLKQEHYLFVDKGNSITTYNKMKGISTWPSIYIGLHNDNQVKDIDVFVQVLALKVRYSKEKKVQNKYKISKRKVPIFG